NTGMTAAVTDVRASRTDRGATSDGMPSPAGSPAADPQLDDELRQLIHEVKTTRRTVKNQLGQARLTNQFLAALEERLQAFQARLELTAQEAQNNGSSEEADV